MPEKTFIIKIIENVLSDEEWVTLVDALKAILQWTKKAKI